MNKEFGSDFNFLTDEEFLLKDSSKSLFKSSEIALFFSGRVALYQLLQQGINTDKWEKVFVPSYYCHEVVDYLKDLPIEIIYYKFNPISCGSDYALDIEDKKGNVIINVIYFGLVKLDLNGYNETIVIDDLTHNFSAFFKSTADYCFGSLRKEFPIPVGGFCSSPKKNHLPLCENTSFAERVSAKKLSSMFLKNMYLKGQPIEKSTYRNLFAEAEREFENKLTNAALPESAKGVLVFLDILKISLVKKQNMNVACKELFHTKEFFNNKHSSEEAFGLIFLCHSQEQKEKFRHYLISNLIFPATLWPNQIRDEDIAIENQLVFVPVDFRYNELDIKYIANKIKLFFQDEL